MLDPGRLFPIIRPHEFLFGFAGLVGDRCNHDCSRGSRGQRLRGVDGSGRGGLFRVVREVRLRGALILSVTLARCGQWTDA